MRSAVSISISAFGAFAAFAGVEHGVGEMLQGNIAPPGVVIESWAGSEAFGILGGEPAMTIVPNLLASGILTVLAALTFGVWAVRFIERRNGGVVLIGLSAVLLLVGGGFAPPILGLILGVAAMRMSTAPIRPRTTTAPHGLLARLWPWTLGAGVIAFLALVPGTVIVAYVFDIADTGAASAVVLVPMVSAFTLLAVTLVAASLYDRERRGVAGPATATGG